MSPLLLQSVITRTIRGAFMADAASMGTHWIYNPQDVLDKITSVQQPEFRNPPAPNFYSSTEFPNHYEMGMLSPYGEQLLFVTQYVATTTPINVVTGPGMSTEMWKWATTFGGRPDHATTTFVEHMKAGKVYPECGADDDQGMCVLMCLCVYIYKYIELPCILRWLLAAVNPRTTKKQRCDVTQLYVFLFSLHDFVTAHIFMKVVPVTCRYINGPNNSLLIQKVAEIIRVHQNNDTAVAFGIIAARILEAIMLSSLSSTPVSLLQSLDAVYDQARSDLESILGSSKSDVIETVLVAYQRGKQAATEFATLDDLLLQLSHEKMKDQPDNAFYDLAARSCALPGSFIGPIYQFYKVAQSSEMVMDEQVYVSAIRENILAAGDTCSRGVFVGAVLAAAVPSFGSTMDAWWEQVEAKTRTDIAAYADQIAARQVETAEASSDNAKTEL